MAELADFELDDEMLNKAAGGVCWSNCPGEGTSGHHVCGIMGWETSRDADPKKVLSIATSYKEAFTKEQRKDRQ